MRSVKKILIVDDEPLVARIISVMFGRMGYETKIASDGKVALEILETEHVDIVITDMSMPNINGLELCYAIKRNLNGNLPVILCTAVIERKEEWNCFNDIFMKPLNFMDLVGGVKRLLDAKK